MKIKTITIYALKSTRKNAKTKYKTYKAYFDTPYQNIKTKFTYNDFEDLKQFIELNKKDYPLFNFCVYVDNICLHSFAKHYKSDNQVTTILKQFMELLNK